MNPLKFRIYDQDLKDYLSSPAVAKMLMESELTTENDQPVVVVSGERLIFEVDTGLTDRRDRPIFDGDILENNGVYYPVKYSAGRFTSTDERLWLKSIAKDGRVVGDIHHNSDLLQ